MSGAAYAHGALTLGRGPGLLLLPGFGCGHRIMRPLADALAARARVLVVDHRGMGLAPAAAEPYTFENLADDNWATADAHGLKNVVVAGTSMGGLVAQVMALRAQKRVRALVLMCTLSNGPGYVAPEARDAAALRAFFGAPDYPRQSITHGVADDYPERDPAAFEALVALKAADRACAEQALLQAEAFDHFMAHPLPEAIGCPVLVLHGDQDRIVDPANSAKLRADLPHAQGAVFENTGHLFFLERPTAVAEAIFSFMETL